MPKTRRKKETEANKRAREAMDAFEKNSTYDTFYKMCDLVRKSDEWQCAKSLILADEIPVPELEKILEFLATQGQDEKWDGCQFPAAIDSAVSAHTFEWLNMSGERFECLFPYLDESFLSDLGINGMLRRDPKEMTPETLRTVLDAILTPH